MVSLREKPPHVRHSLSVVMMIVDEGTIRMFKGKARYKSPFLVYQLSVFIALARYRVVKIMCSSSEVVLQTTKHTVIYPSSSPSMKVIALHPAA
jgi:hypothetical protein